MAQNGLAVLCTTRSGRANDYSSSTAKPPSPAAPANTRWSVSGAWPSGNQRRLSHLGRHSLHRLSSRREVDPKRIGCTGNPAAARSPRIHGTDDRIVCAAPSCYITSLERLFATIGPQDAEQNIVGQVAFGMEHVDYLTMRAPRPTLMCIASQDYFDQIGSWATFREASQVFAKLGHGERVALFEYDDKHGFSKPRREAAMRWMRRWLLNSDDAPKEGDFKHFTDEQLQCTRSGQVLADFKGVSAFGLNMMEAKKHVGSRSNFASLGEKERQATIRRLLGMPADIPTATQHRQKIHYLEDRLSTHKVVFETEPGIVVPGLRFKHIQPKGPPVIYLPENGMPKDAKLPAWLDEKYQKNHQEIWFDLRGLRRNRARASPARNPAISASIKENDVSAYFESTLWSLRARRAVAHEHDQERPRRNRRASAQPVSSPCMLRVDGRVREVTLEKTLKSWQSVVETPIQRQSVEQRRAGVLKHYDLPELEKSLAARVLRVRPLDLHL